MCVRVCGECVCVCVCVADPSTSVRLLGDVLCFIGRCVSASYQIHVCLMKLVFSVLFLPCVFAS
jgi:hypothetical protein